MRSVAVVIVIAFGFSTALRAQRPDCKETKDPKNLPPVSMLLDSARAIAELAALDAPAGLLFTLVFRDHDSLPLVRPLDDTDSTAVRILTNSVRSQAKSKAWAVRVRVVKGPVSSLRFERAMYCPPVPIPETVQGTVSGIVRIEVESPSQIPRSPGPIRFEVLVAVDGVPAIVNITRSSGYRELDEQFLQTWRQARFQPALLDGVALEAWYRSDGKSPRL